MQNVRAERGKRACERIHAIDERLNEKKRKKDRTNERFNERNEKKKK